MKHTREVMSEEEYTTCDVCEKETRALPCVGCRRDVCADCSVAWAVDPWTGVDTGDYPPRVCAVCDGLSWEFAEKAQHIRNEADEKVDVLHNQWLAVAKRNQ